MKATLHNWLSNGLEANLESGFSTIGLLRRGAYEKFAHDEDTRSDALAFIDWFETNVNSEQVLGEVPDHLFPVEQVLLSWCRQMPTLKHELEFWHVQFERFFAGRTDKLFSLPFQLEIKPTQPEMMFAYIQWLMSSKGVSPEWIAQTGWIQSFLPLVDSACVEAFWKLFEPFPLLQEAVNQLSNPSLVQVDITFDCLLDSNKIENIYSAWYRCFGLEGLMLLMRDVNVNSITAGSQLQQLYPSIERQFEPYINQLTLSAFAPDAPKGRVFRIKYFLSSLAHQLNKEKHPELFLLTTLQISAPYTQQLKYWIISWMSGPLKSSLTAIMECIERCKSYSVPETPWEDTATWADAEQATMQALVDYLVVHDLPANSYAYINSKLNYKASFRTYFLDALLRHFEALKLEAEQTRDETKLYGFFADLEPNSKFSLSFSNESQEPLKEHLFTAWLIKCGQTPSPNFQAALKYLFGFRSAHFCQLVSLRAMPGLSASAFSALNAALAQAEYSFHFLDILEANWYHLEACLKHASILDVFLFELKGDHYEHEALLTILDKLFKRLDVLHKAPDFLVALLNNMNKNYATNILNLPFAYSTKTVGEHLNSLPINYKPLIRRFSRDVLLACLPQYPAFLYAHREEAENLLASFNERSRWEILSSNKLLRFALQNESMFDLLLREAKVLGLSLGEAILGQDPASSPLKFLNLNSKPALSALLEALPEEKCKIEVLSLYLPNEKFSKFFDSGLFIPTQAFEQPEQIKAYCHDWAVCLMRFYLTTIEYAESRQLNRFASALISATNNYVRLREEGDKKKAYEALEHAYEQSLDAELELLGLEELAPYFECQKAFDGHRFFSSKPNPLNSKFSFQFHLDALEDTLENGSFPPLVNTSFGGPSRLFVTGC